MCVVRVLYVYTVSLCTKCIQWLCGIKIYVCIYKCEGCVVSEVHMNCLQCVLCIVCVVYCITEGLESWEKVSSGQGEGFGLQPRSQLRQGNICA